MNTKEQVERLMNEVLPFAEQMLAAHGEFHPFGGYLTPKIEVVHVGVRPIRGNATAIGRLNNLIDYMRGEKDKNAAIAIAVVTNVSLSESGKGDAIRVFLEHVDGYCAEVFFGYEVKSSAIRLLDTTAQQGENLFWS